MKGRKINGSIKYQPALLTVMNFVPSDGVFFVEES